MAWSKRKQQATTPSGAWAGVAAFHATIAPAPLPPTWPTNADYIAAVQNPQASLEDQELRVAHTYERLPGFPESVTGQNAVVFRMRGPAGDLALRCFTRRPNPVQAERYRALSALLSTRPMPEFVTAGWRDHGVKVRGLQYPIVKMAWAPGKPMTQFIESHSVEANRTNEIARRFLELVTSIKRSGIIHGDLQHGNVLIEESLQLRLVDYDSVTIIGSNLPPPREVGHPNYQHPDRLTKGVWNEFADTFAALVIYTSLRALATDPELIRFSKGENLVLHEDDLKAPGLSPVFHRLSRNPAHEVRELTGCLRDWLGRPLESVHADLGSIVRARALPAPPSTRIAAAWYLDPLPGRLDTPSGIDEGLPRALTRTSKVEPTPTTPTTQWANLGQSLKSRAHITAHPPTELTTAHPTRRGKSARPSSKVISATSRPFWPRSKPVVHWNTHGNARARKQPWLSKRSVRCRMAFIERLW